MNKVKRICCLLLAVCLVCGAAACGRNEPEPDPAA